MTTNTNTNESDQPTTGSDAATTAILPDWVTPAPHDAAATAPEAPAPTAPPTVRWGALVWALLFGTAAATTLWVLVDPARRDLVGDWMVTLSPLTATLTAVIVVGVVIALFGIVGLIRRGERARR